MANWQTEFGWRIPAGIQAHGGVRVPGDKSISHRSVILAALADGTSRIRGFLAGEDSLCTARAFAQMGVRIDGLGTTELVVHGVGHRGLQTPTADLDMGNAGTGMRLMAGTMAGQGIACTITGDASLRRRPMRRIIEPLRQMGAQIVGEGAGDTAPLHLTPAPLQYSRQAEIRQKNKAVQGRPPQHPKAGSICMRQRCGPLSAAAS